MSFHFNTAPDLVWPFATVGFYGASFWLMHRRRTGTALLLLVCGALALRFWIASGDLYLNDWDESFHALVAKNMMHDPLRPTLFASPVLPYDYTQWWNNHIWLHKQPLFLWQMALSMTLFGVNEFALRLPGALMGALVAVFVFRMVKLWMGDDALAYGAALLSSLNHFSIELANGRYATDHNDAAFVFYVTASIWACCEYFFRPSWRWALLVGLFTGCAVLVKWLPGLLVYGGWGTAVLLNKRLRTQRRPYLQLLCSVLICVAVFLPWQIYTWLLFPLEHAYELQLSTRHFAEVIETHGGGPWFHFQHLGMLYGAFVWVAIAIGLVASFAQRRTDKNLSVLFFTCAAAVYAFYSLAATKMPAFTLPAFGVMVAYCGLTLWSLAKIVSPNGKTQRIVFYVLLILFSLHWLRPWEIVSHRSPANTERNDKLFNTRVYKQLPDSVMANYVVFNCPKFENLDLMFYRGGTAYYATPDSTAIDGLLNRGVKIAAFKSNPDYVLPDYMHRRQVLWLDYALR